MCWHSLFELNSFSALNPDWFIHMNWDSPWHPFDIADGTIVYDEYSTPARWSSVMLVYTTMIAWCCLFSYFISELRRDGLWAYPQLSSYSWWGCEYNMYCCWQNYSFNLWEMLVYVSYNTDWPGCSVGHPAGALALICLWVLLAWLTYAYGMLCQEMTSILESFYSSNVHANFVGLGISIHVCLWSMNDCYIIKQHGTHAWYGCWTIKALVEAEVYDGRMWVAGA